MKILIATDKFKGSLTAIEAGEALRRGFARVLPEASVTVFPLADGGEGTLDVLTRCFGLKEITVPAHDPLLRPIRAAYGLNDSRKCAVVEMAKASGLGLLAASERNCFFTSTYGTGELIADAITRGASTIYLTAGGSATNDGGTGMAEALGYRFLDEAGNRVIPSGERLRQMTRIDATPSTDRLKRITFFALTDVQNILAGPEGATFVYGPQKGASPEQIIQLDFGLVHLGELLQRDLGVSIITVKGGGAAGGLGAGAVAFLGAKLEVGCESVMKHTGFDKAMAEADVVITGEGRIDIQSGYGKVVGAVGLKGTNAGKRVVAVAGQNMLKSTQFNAIGISSVYALTEVSTLNEAMHDAAALLENGIAEQISEELRQNG